MTKVSENNFSYYERNSQLVWKNRFTWTGLYGTEKAWSISIEKFFKENSHIYDPNIKSSSDFQKWTFSIASRYVEWCSNNYEVSLSDDEKADLRNFFVGALGEYFFINILNEFKKFVINKKWVSFNCSTPLLPSTPDFGIDGTCITSYDDKQVSAAIQVKFWHEYSSFKITMSIAQKAYGQAVLDGIIEPTEYKNIVICWLGTDKKVSRYLKENKKLMAHIVFFDGKVLDDNINNKDCYFWKTRLPIIMDWINKI